MELELKHLAPYLPYSLKLTDKLGNRYNTAWMSTKNIAFIDVNSYGELQKLSWKNANGRIKPILRPLSDLTNPEVNLIFHKRADNEITINRYVSDLSEELTITATYKMMGDVFTDFVICRNSINNVDYWIVEILLINHYDIFGLIPKGLAIDINTL